MTEQVRDGVTLDGVSLVWAKSPRLPELHPRLVCEEEESEYCSTSCGRGYQSFWEISEGNLFLSHINGKYRLIGDEPLFADWYSGTAIVGYGYDWNSSTLFKSLLHVEFANGIVISKREESCTDTPSTLGEVVVLLAGGADIDKWVDRDNKTMLYSAVREDSPDMLQYLLAKGARVGEEILSLAVELGRQSVVEVFLSAAQNKNAAASHLLHHAARFGNSELCKLLLSNGADVNCRLVVMDDDRTPILRAARGGHREIVDLFISNGADVNSQDKNGMTPLQAAIWCQDTNIANQLIDNGADIAGINMENDEGHTFLHHFSRKNKYAGIVKFLIAKGADVNAANINGVTPLHKAAFGVMVIAQLLITNGADVNAKDNDGETPLHVAAKWGYKDIAEILIAHGADIGVMSKAGCSPLDYAIAEKNDSVFELLCKQGGIE